MAAPAKNARESAGAEKQRHSRNNLKKRDRCAELEAKWLEKRRQADRQSRTSLLTLNALWFAGSDVAVVLIGILSWLASALDIPRVRWSAVAANSTGVLSAVAFMRVAGWSQPQGVVLLVLFVAGALSALYIRVAVTRRL